MDGAAAQIEQLIISALQPREVSRGDRKRNNPRVEAIQVDLYRRGTGSGLGHIGLCGGRNGGDRGFGVCWFGICRLGIRRFWLFFGLLFVALRSKGRRRVRLEEKGVDALCVLEVYAELRTDDRRCKGTCGMEEDILAA